MIQAKLQVQYIFVNIIEYKWEVTNHSDHDNSWAKPVLDSLYIDNPQLSFNRGTPEKTSPKDVRGDMATSP